MMKSYSNNISTLYQGVYYGFIHCGLQLNIEKITLKFATTDIINGYKKSYAENVYAKQKV